MINIAMFIKVMKIVKLAAVTIVRLCDRYESFVRLQDRQNTVVIESTKPKDSFKFSDIRPAEKLTFLPGSNAADVLDSCFQMLTGHGFLTAVESKLVAERLAEWKADHEYD